MKLIELINLFEGKYLLNGHAVHHGHSPELPSRNNQCPDHDGRAMTISSAFIHVGEMHECPFIPSRLTFGTHRRILISEACVDLCRITLKLPPRMQRVKRAR